MFLELKNLQQCKIHNLILFKLKPNFKKRQIFISYFLKSRLNIYFDIV